MSNHTPFYATRDDLLAVLDLVETQRPLKYVHAGMFDTPQQSAATSFRNIENVGVAVSGATVREPQYLVADISTEISIREVPQRRGGVRYAIDQLQNPATIVLVSGGIYGDAAIIGGELSTVSSDATSVDLYRAIVRRMRKSFRSVKGNLVGPEAERLWANGSRLTFDIRSAQEYDLSR